MLTANAMGLGAWIHASIAPPVLLGQPSFRGQYGAMLGFDWSTPRWKLADIVRWQVPLPKYAYLRDAAVGLRHQGEYLIKAMCPPNYPTMADAVDAVVAEKFGPRGIYSDEGLFARIYRGEFGAQYLRQASKLSFPAGILNFWSTCGVCASWGWCGTAVCDCEWSGGDGCLLGEAGDRGLVGAVCLAQW